MKNNESIYRMFDMLIELNNAVSVKKNIKSKNAVNVKKDTKLDNEKNFKIGKQIDEILKILNMSLDEFIDKIIDIQHAFPDIRGYGNSMKGYTFLIDLKKDGGEEEENDVDTLDPKMLKDVLGGNPVASVYAAYVSNNYLYVSLTDGEYTALKTFAQNHQLESLLDEDVLYRMHPDYNEYLIMNKENVVTIREAIDEGNKIQFQYGKEGEKTILPIMLYEDANFGYTYVIYQRKRKYHFYRVDRMSDITIVNDGHDKQTMGDMTQEQYNDLNRRINSCWGTSGGEKEVKFKVYNDNGGAVIRKVMRDLQPYIDHAGYQTQTDEEGNLIVTGTVIGTSDFERYVRSYGASIVVISPEKMRESICQSAQDRLRDLGVSEEDIPKLK